MNYDETMKKLIEPFDLNTETQRKKAFVKCIEYADSQLSESIEYNAFVKYTAERLGQSPVVKPIIRRLVKESGSERLHLTYSESTGPVLTCNKPSLLYLSQVLQKLSESNLAGDHVHFYHGEHPLSDNSYPLTIYYENDAWFENLGEKEEAEEGNDEAADLPQKGIVPAEIRAFLVTQEPPPAILLSKNSLYKVLSYEKLSDQRVWKKAIRKDSERMYVLEFLNDDGRLEKLGVDLDDDEVMFFSANQLRQFADGT